MTENAPRTARTRVIVAAIKAGIPLADIALVVGAPVEDVRRLRRRYVPEAAPPAKTVEVGTRLAAGWTQAQIARDLKISPARVSQIAKQLKQEGNRAGVS